MVASLGVILLVVVILVGYFDYATLLEGCWLVSALLTFILVYILVLVEDVSVYLLETQARSGRLSTPGFYISFATTGPLAYSGGGGHRLQWVGGLDLLFSQGG